MMGLWSTADFSPLTFPLWPRLPLMGCALTCTQAFA